ncbi:hypothetical protein, partial [Spirosoma lituiforme]
RLGYEVAKQQGGRKWYRYRNEKTASFVLSKDGLAWFDHGTGKGGNIIDLAMMEAGTDSVHDALQFIEKTVGFMSYAIPPIRQRLPVVTETAYTVEAIRIMTDRRGENWCRSRGLDIDACRPYLSDIYFNRATKPLSKPLYAVGVPNIFDQPDKRCLEMRTQLNGGPWIKSSIGQKTITVFQSGREITPWYLFEGLPDFCTFLTHRRPTINEMSFLILNGVGMTSHAIDYLKQQPTGSLTLCPQHGSQGSLKSCEVLRDFVANNGWNGGNIDYPADSYDYNAWHMSKKGLKPIAAPSASGPRLKSTLNLKL